MVIPFPKSEPPPFHGIPGTFEEHCADELRVDTRYQRAIRKGRVRRIVKNFRNTGFSFLTLSARDDGTFVVLDGQHRLTAIRELGWGEHPLPCVVYRGLTLEDEAEIFESTQSPSARLSLAPADRFKARLIAKETTALAINATVEAFGYHLNFTGGTTRDPNDIDAISAIEFVWNRHGPGSLSTLLAITRAAFPTSENVHLSGALLAGLSSFLHRYHGMYFDDRLLFVLRKVTPVHYTEDGKTIRKAIGGGFYDAVGRAILKEYNYKLSTNKLPEWDAVRIRRSGGRTDPMLW